MTDQPVILSTMNEELVEFIRRADGKNPATESEEDTGREVYAAVRAVGQSLES